MSNATIEPTDTASPGKSGLILDASNFNFSVHDGILTIHNPATGNHRTFKLETQPADAEFAPGKRIVSLLTGPNRNEWGDWQRFAWADDTGIRVWRRYEGTNFGLFARMIENPPRWAAKGAVYMLEAHCRRCGRPLSNPSSISSGLGPVCAGRMLA